MKTFGVAIVLLGLMAANSAFAQDRICAGAEGSSQACAAACSGTIVNDDVRGTPNAGKFNVGGGNQGDGNDGFNNVGSFNIGSSNLGNCAITSASSGGSCDPGNNAGQIVLRFCRVLPTDPKCSPSGYLPEFTQALKDQLSGVVASCNGVVVPSPPPATVSPPSPADGQPPPAPGSPAASPPSPAGPTPPIAPDAATPPASSGKKGPLDIFKKGDKSSPVDPVVPVPSGSRMTPFVSDSKADLATLLALFDEHINQEKATGRKLKM